MSKRSNSHFARGSGVFKCSSCTRSTRSRGGDGAHVGVCEECYELAGYVNQLTDDGELSLADCEYVITQAEFVTAHGGTLDDEYVELLTYARGVAAAQSDGMTEEPVAAALLASGFAYASREALQAMEPEARASYRKARRAAAKARRKAG